MKKNILYGALCFGFFASVVFASLPYPPRYFAAKGHDSQWYILLSEGKVGEVVKPFAGRFLYPFLAGTIDKYLPLNIEHSFFVLGMASLLFFLYLNTLILKKTLPSPLLIVPILFLPYLFEMSREIFILDIFYIALSAFFFWTLVRKAEWASVIVLFLLFLTRESTILLGLLMLLVSWLYKKKMLFTGTLLVIILSVIVVGALGSAGLPNPHHVGNITYLALKLTYNFFNNFFGIKFWTNTLAGNCEPILRAALPGWSVFGSIREAGLCGWNPTAPLETFSALLTMFGIAPGLLAYIIYKKRSALLSTPFWLALAGIYGVAHFILGVPAGTGVARIVAYGWPAFILVLPFLMKQTLSLNKHLLIKLSFIHLFVAWVPFALQSIMGRPPLAFLLPIVLAIPCYIWTILLIKRQES